MKTKVAIIGYGNIGRAVEQALQVAEALAAAAAQTGGVA